MIVYKTKTEVDNTMKDLVAKAIFKYAVECAVVLINHVIIVRELENVYDKIFSNLEP